MKVSVSFPEDLLKRIDDASAHMYMSRSLFMAMACRQYLRALTSDGCRDCYTCRYSAVEIQGLVCRGLYNGFPIKRLALLVGSSCPCWEKDGKQVNEIERTV